VSKPLDHARQLRQDQTDTEQFVWGKLRNRRFCAFKFRRQVPLKNYIADFVCFDRQLIIELDGGQHTVQQEYDQRRTTWLESQGFRVLRFWNHEVFQDWEAIEELIWRKLQEELPDGKSERRP
jgi:very-short-patch-repair endonuclease